MAERLRGKVAIVFGAGSSGPGWGNGKACAVAYAREGARVLLVDREADAVEETRGIIAAEGGECLAATADATRSGEVEAAVARAAAAWGGLDILHNNVGLAEMGGPEELSEAAWRRVMDANATSVLLAAKHAIPHMLRRGGGAIVNISSVAAVRWTGYPYLAYCAAKAAVNQMTVGIALQYARRGIRCNAVMLGMIDTPVIYRDIAGQHASVEEMVAARHAATPMGRMGTAWDVAAACVFLASDEAGFITGHCLPVDGGHSMRVG